jgi:hypothetical protein
MGRRQLPRDTVKSLLTPQRPSNAQGLQGRCDENHGARYQVTKCCVCFVSPLPQKTILLGGPFFFWFYHKNPKQMVTSETSPHRSLPNPFAGGLPSSLVVCIISSHRGHPTQQTAPMTRVAGGGWCVHLLGCSLGSGTPAPSLGPAVAAGSARLHQG